MQRSSFRLQWWKTLSRGDDLPNFLFQLHEFRRRFPFQPYHSRCDTGRRQRHAGKMDKKRLAKTPPADYGSKTFGLAVFEIYRRDECNMPVLRGKPPDGQPPPLGNSLADLLFEVGWQVDRKKDAPFHPLDGTMPKPLGLDHLPPLPFHQISMVDDGIDLPYSEDDSTERERSLKPEPIPIKRKEVSGVEPRVLSPHIPETRHRSHHRPRQRQS